MLICQDHQVSLQKIKICISQSALFIYLKVLCIILACSAAVFSGERAVNISSVFESKGRLGSVKVLVVGEGKG